MSLTVSTSLGNGYGKVIVNQDGDRNTDDYKAFRRIGAFALTYKRRTWKNPDRPWNREEPNTPPTAATWSLTTRPGEQQNIATIITNLIENRADALKEWNKQ